MDELTQGIEFLKNYFACGHTSWLDETKRRPQSQAAKLTVGFVFWLSISWSGLDFDDIAAEGIFTVADPKLCFYSYWRASQL